MIPPLDEKDSTPNGLFLTNYCCQLVFQKLKYEFEAWLLKHLSHLSDCVQFDFTLVTLSSLVSTLESSKSVLHNMTHQLSGRNLAIDLVWLVNWYNKFHENFAVFSLHCVTTLLMHMFLHSMFIWHQIDIGMYQFQYT